MNQPNPAARGCLWGMGTWVILIGVSLVFESLFNSGSGGPGPGMPPIPGALIAAVLLGWIPAGLVGLWNYRRNQP